MLPGREQPYFRVDQEPSDPPAEINSSCPLPCHTASFGQASSIAPVSLFPSSDFIYPQYRRLLRKGKIPFCERGIHSRSLINACLIEQGSRAGGPGSGGTMETKALPGSLLGSKAPPGWAELPALPEEGLVRVSGRFPGGRTARPSRKRWQCQPVGLPGSSVCPASRARPAAEGGGAREGVYLPRAVVHIRRDV